MRNNDEPDVRVGKTLRDLGRKEAGYEKPDEGVGSVLLRGRFEFFAADEGKGDAEGDGCLDIAHRSEGAERDDA